jgi:hypothetical protein
MSERILGALLVVLGGVARGAPAEAAVSQPVDAGTGFHLEGRPSVDDVFGDAADYRRTVDRFLELTAQMQQMRDEFARAVQTALNELGVRGPENKKGPAHRHGCPIGAVAGPYARAYHLGGEYLRVGRELTRHYEQVKEFDRLGESIGLTPDYRWKVKRVLQQYSALLVDYREMKSAFHDQLVDELRYAGCDLQALLLRGDPQARPTGSDSWPQPGRPGAPGVQLAKNDAPREKGPPANLPVEKLQPPQPIAFPKHTAPADPSVEAPRSGVLFYVDNTRCQRIATVYIDGRKLGDVPAATRVGFQTAPGPHDLCLLDSPKKECGAPGTVRRSYLHEGWTISLRCE